MCAPVLSHVLVPIHREGWKFVAIFAVISVILGLLWEPLGWVGAVLTLWCVYFFRDPPRVTPVKPGLVISPADGLVVSVGPAVPPVELGMGPEPMMRIGIFLNVFDVHINRTPMTGTVLATHYHKGQFLNASFDKASDLNERNGLRIATEAGAEIAVVQIAGLVARRILCHVGAGQNLLAGERFGLIRFGSRTDLYLPPSWAIQTIVGQRVVGGETILADANLIAPPLMGEVR
ncbi:MAG TPA: phosphatidylserine decarboxylase [Stellaceae bacterium]|jgi:phosphatidylserine decarboxylase|nr:phosphatidylserine decarboxylase [Stellaceae bacterium]